MANGRGARRNDGNSYEPPARRSLKIYAVDPSLGGAPSNKVSIDIPYEPLVAGPEGEIFRVVDWAKDVGPDGTYFAPVDLDDPDVLAQDGLDHSESDPRFHQQMVYAVCMRVLENFEIGLGRRIRFYDSGTTFSPLVVMPHAFYDANAYYQPLFNLLAFGYFQSKAKIGSPFVPGQLVFTCLSHDVIAHELTHAIIHRLRWRLLEPSNADVLAFHEGFADIVALFQRFSYAEVVGAHMTENRGNLRRGGLLDLARQFGQALDRDAALRSALDDGQVDPKRLGKTVEPHARGSILVAALFDGFLTVYERRIADLRRIASGGSGVLPDGDLHPDLTNRYADEATKTARSVLTMCVRAFDYLPPADVTFGDFLRALVTADHDFVKVDRLLQLEAIIDGFRRRGIYPDNVVSLAPESLLWPAAPGDLPRLEPRIVRRMLESLAFELDRATLIDRHRMTRDKRQRQAIDCYRFQIESEQEILAFHEDEVIDSFRHKLRHMSRWKRQMAHYLYRYAQSNATALGLDKDLPIAVEGLHATTRHGAGLRPRFHIIVQYGQRDDEAHRVHDLGGLRLRGGTTVVFDREGQPTRVIAKPARMTDAIRERAAEFGWPESHHRLGHQLDYLANLDSRDPLMPWRSKELRDVRMASRASFRALHARHGG